MVQENNRTGVGSEGRGPKGSRWAWLIGIGCVAVVILAMLAPRHGASQKDPSLAISRPSQREPQPGPEGSIGLAPKPTAEQVVAGKLDQFARDRLRITRALAKRNGTTLPAEVDEFYKAVAANKWDDLNALYHSLEKIRDAGDDGLRNLWAPILETLLVAECVHSWPAQKLLDYGQATLGFLEPGMVYVGGTDPGRGIPTFLNETSGGERHVILTQNALADAGYMDYVRFLYGDQLQLPTEAESREAFKAYMADAQRRLQHDQQFPDEPKQVKPGEQIQWNQGAGTADGSGDGKPRITVSGNVAVMSINERILQGILDKNPGMAFAMEESFPLLSTYGSAVPLGPLMELRAPNGQDSFTLDTAGAALDYWRTTLDQLQMDADAPEGSDVRKTYSHMAVAQANLLASHSYTAEAEATYRAALDFEPSNQEAVYGLSRLLGQTGRVEEAQMLANDFARTHPNQPALPESTFIMRTEGN